MGKILGIGNALVDIMTLGVEDAKVLEMGFLKGSMQLVDFEKSQEVYANTSQYTKELTAGGSAANTINGLANLGLSTSFIGKIGEDEIGDMFRNDMVKNAIDPKLYASSTPAGRAIALITADGERTFATYLGAAVELTAADLDPEVFKEHSILHIEGYLVQNHDLIRSAVKMAKELGLKVSIDMASFNVVEANLEFLQEIVREYVDIVFANEEEARSFTGQEPETALDTIAEMAEIAVVKIGSKGSYIKTGNQIYSIPPITANCIDTTGAGDLYASGVLYGINKGYSLDVSGRIGSLLAGNVIEVVGAKMDADRWSKIRKQVAEIVSAN